jgi:hypothetical protein
VLELIVNFLMEIFFYKIGCWSLWLFSLGKLKWDDKGQGNPYLMSIFGFIVFILLLIIIYNII